MQPWEALPPISRSQPFTTRRTVYAHIDRQNLPGVFRTFDFAGPDTHAPKRHETTVPQQALFQMNSPFVLEMAAAAATAARESSDGPTTVIQRLYHRILRRDPLPEEVDFARAFLSDKDAPEDDAAWPQLAQVLMLTNEFVFID